MQLHFLDFDVQATNDMLEVRDGVGPNSTLLGEAVIFPQSFSAELGYLLHQVINLYVVFSHPHRERQPRPWLVLNNQSDGGVVLYG